MKDLKTNFYVILVSLITLNNVFSQELPARVTILYDAFGKTSPLKRGWGYSAPVEYGGKRIHSAHHLSGVTLYPTRYKIRKQ